jgi:C1A family cysteine protease
MLKSLVYSHGAVVVSVQEASKIYEGVRAGEIFEGCSNDPDAEYDHALAVVGDGDGEDGPYWIIKNSWGAAWGDKGFFWLRRGKGECGIGRNFAAITCSSTV